jgi:ankyrin repeat protein
VAAKNGHEDVVKLLLAAKAKVNCKEEFTNSHAPLAKAAENGHEGIVKLLLAAKAEVDFEDINNNNPLSHAAANGHEGIVKLLLAAKAKVDTEQYGRTALSRATANGHKGVVKLLLEANANVTDCANDANIADIMAEEGLFLYPIARDDSYRQHSICPQS